MKYWDDEFIEERNIYEGQFRSFINTPALKGNIMNNAGQTIRTYEFEIIKEPCTEQTRLDPNTFNKVTDMCVTFEYRTKRIDGIINERTATGSLPLSELTDQLKDILINAHLIL
jgi:hypothetical protein